MTSRLARIPCAALLAAMLITTGGRSGAALLGYWNFDGPAGTTPVERLKDKSGNNYNGTDRNTANAATRALFNNTDIPIAPLTQTPGNSNYCLDLSGTDRYVIMEGTTAFTGPGAVDTQGNVFNIGNSSAVSVPVSAGKLTVAFWFKGVSPNNWGNYVAKGGEAYATPGYPTWEGWVVRRNNNNSRIAFTTRGFGLLAANGDGDSGQDWCARSGVPLGAPTVSATDVNISNNIAAGMWQHCACVWDGTWKQWYANGYHIRSEQIGAGATYVGTRSRLVFGADENPNNGAIGGGPRFGRVRLDEIAIWDEALVPGQIEDLARGADPRVGLRTSIRPFDFAWPPAAPATNAPTAASHSPGTETATNLLDGNSATKYLNFAGRASGFIVSPAGNSTVRSFTLTTANDADTRDPASYEIYGTNAPVTSLNHTGGTAESWTLIASGALSLPAARLTLGAAVDITNSTAYSSYKMVFVTLKGAAETLFQLADVQFYASPGAAGAPILAAGQPIVGIARSSMPFHSAGAASSGYTSGPLLPQGGPGTLGIFEMRANGNLRRPDGNIAAGTNATVYALDSPVLFARWGTANAPAGTFGVPPYPFARSTTGTSIDFGDPQSGANSGFNGIHTDFLTNSGADDNQFFQMIQGCFRVAAPGRYTFTLKGDDGAQLAIAGATWVTRYADNGSGSIAGEFFQNGQPTGDTAAIAVAEFPAAGDYNFRYQWNEQGGGAWNEVLYAQGERSAYDASLFKTLGNPAGGLTLVDHKPIMELRSSSTYVQAGAPSSITLRWDAAYATTVTLNGGTFSNTDVTAATLNGYGSTSIPTPAATTTYTVTGVRGAGTPVMAAVTVYVDAPPQLFTLTADDSTLTAGAPMTLRWTGIGGTNFQLNDGVTNTNVTPNTQTLLTGSQSGSLSLPAPAADTTYTLTATNTNGSATPIVLMIDIGPPPNVSFTADAASLLPGAYATLTWNVTGADSRSISPGIGAVAASGTFSVQPVQSTTYTLTATNIYSTTVANVPLAMPVRLGVDSSAWTVTSHYWNRFGYLDPVYGNRTTVNMAAYQVGEMTAIPDSALGARGPDAGSFNDPNGRTTFGPAVPPSSQPGNTQKLLMRYRTPNLPAPNFNEAGASAGNLPGDVRPPPALTTITYDQYAVEARANLVVNIPGSYVLGINNDDGGRLRIDTNNDGDFTDGGETLVQDETYHGFFSNIVLSASVNLPAGSYPIEYIYFENAGGSGGEVWYVDTDDNCLIKQLPVITTPLTGGVTTDVIISEFMAVNSRTLEDLEESTPDWVELYNGTASAISLNGYYLTDAAPVLNKWAFPAAASIPAGGYLLVFPSGKADRIPPPPAAELHTNFTLGGGAGYLALTKNNGMGGYTTLSAFTYPDQRADISYTSGGYMSIPTPARVNMGTVGLAVVGDTHFNVDRGIKSAPFNLIITKDDADPLVAIRYTIDGSIPTLSNGSTYTAPIPISTTTVVRARAMKHGAIPTNVDTQSYLFPDDVIFQNTVTAVSRGWPNQVISGQYFDFGMDAAIVTGRETEVKDALKAIPTVSLVTSMVNLTDPRCGIFVESQQRGRGWERDCSIELINDTGDLNGDFQIDCGVRSRGGFSRNDGNPKHSWHLFFRGSYGGDLRYPLFGAGGAGEYEQIDLATANNYSWSYSPDAGNIRTFPYTNTSLAAASYVFRHNTFLRDPVARDLQQDMSGITTRNKYVHLYINGQYWGVHYFQERAEASFGATYLGGNKDNFDVVKSAGNANGYMSEVTDGDYTAGITGTAAADGSYVSDWARLYGGALDLRQRNGVTLGTAADNNRNLRLFKLMGYDYISGAQTITRNPAYPVLLDVNHLIDYIIIIAYCGAYDAPLSTFLNNASNNWMALRDRTSNDQGFIFIAWDFEHGMGTDFMSGDLTAGTNQDIDYSAGVNMRFTFTPANNTVTSGFRSTNRLGPWGLGAASLNPRSNWQTNQHFRGAFSAGNPEYYQNSNLYNNGTDYSRSNPQYLHEFLAFAPEYRRMFGDRAQCVLRQSGPLTTSKVMARINQRAAQLVNAILAESARWGNAKGVALANYDKNAWLGAVQNVRDWVTHGSNQILLNSLPINDPANPGNPRPGTGSPGPGRAEVIVSQLKNYRDGGLGAVGTAGPWWVVNGLFPSIDAPTYSSWGGVVSSGTLVSLTNPNAANTNQTVYYSVAGIDPRPLGGGAPSGGASIGPNGTGAGTTALTATGTLVSRVYDSVTAEWSAMARADFIVGTPAAPGNIIISEINYNPRDATPGTPTGGEIQTFEFIELLNVTGSPLDLTSLRFTTGIDFTFPTGRVLPVGGRIVVAKDLAAFASRYPDGSYPGLSGKTVGPFDGQLDNGGEQIVLTAHDGTVIADFTYDDTPPWPVTPDGTNGNGATLVYMTACPGVSSPASAVNWYGHPVVRGNPGGPDGTSYSAWTTANGASANGSGDVDKDGMSDLLEYLTGSSPNGSSVHRWPLAGSGDFTVNNITDRYLTFTYTRKADTSDTAVDVQVNSGLSPAAWTNTGVLVNRTQNGDGTDTFVYRAPNPISANPRTQMRLRVTCASVEP